MNVADVAEFYGVSKEAIHNRIRRGSLQSVVEDGVKLVLIDKHAKTNVANRTVTRKVSVSQDDRYYKLLEEQNAKLLSRVEVLESETRTLRDQKEQMLIEERIKIEQIYKEKDEQLKNILGAISSQFMLNATVKNGIEEAEHVEAEISEEEPSNFISLKKYFKQNNYSDKQIKKAIKKFKKIAKKDERIIVNEKKYYIDLNKYDYSDLL
jgi:hypothetical protein